MKPNYLIELRAWADTHIKVGNRQAGLILDLCESYERLAKIAAHVEHEAYAKGMEAARHGAGGCNSYPPAALCTKTLTLK